MRSHCQGESASRYTESTAYPLFRNKRRYQCSPGCDGNGTMTDGETKPVFQEGSVDQLKEILFQLMATTPFFRRPFSIGIDEKGEAFSSMTDRNPCLPGKRLTSASWGLNYAAGIRPRDHTLTDASWRRQIPSCLYGRTAEL